MVQILKDAVKLTILEAAEKQFAKDGFTKATMGNIAQRAGVATGNIYKYFPNKKSLFEAIITPEFADEFSTLTSNRISAFATTDGMSQEQNVFEGEAGALLRFWIKNRFKVIIILARSQGTQYESYSTNYVQEMYEQTISQIPAQFPTFQLTHITKFTIKIILTEAIRSIVSILETYTSEKDIAKALIAGWTYQIGGINALTELACSQYEL